MIVAIIAKLSGLTEGLQGSDVVSLGGITDILNINDVIPSFYFQIVVGIYILQIIWILTILSNSIENGDDKIAEKTSLGKNLIRGTLIYVIVAVIGSLVFNLLVGGMNLVS